MPKSTKRQRQPRAANAVTPPEQPATRWQRFAGKYSFVVIAALTAIATAVGTGLVTGVPKTLKAAFADDHPKVSVEKDSDSLQDLSLALAERIERPPSNAAQFVPKGSVKAGRTRHKVILYNSTGAPIRITDIRAKITRKAEPKAGTLLARKPDGAPIEITGIGLWQEPPIARVLDNKGNLGEAFFAIQSVDIGVDETQIISVTAMADAHYYEYELDIAYSRQGEQRSMSASHESMKVTGYAPAYGAAFRWGADRYDPMTSEEVGSWKSIHSAT